MDPELTWTAPHLAPVPAGIFDLETVGANVQVDGPGEDDEAWYGPEAKIEIAEGRRPYLKWWVDTKQLGTNGALLPKGYTPLGELWPCPVVGCQTRWDKLRSLGEHWKRNHVGTAFEDNGDGTLSKVGKCEKTMVVRLRPLPGVAAAASKEKTLSSGIDTAAAKEQKRKRDSAPAPPPKKQRGELPTLQDGPDKRDAQEITSSDGLPNDPVVVHDEEHADRCFSWLSESDQRDFRHRFQNLNKLWRPPAFLNGQTVNDYIALLWKQYERPDVHIFGTDICDQFWNADGGDRSQPSEPTIHCPYLAFPICRNQHWYGAFIDRASGGRPMIVIIDSKYPYRDRDVPFIIGYLVKKGYILPTSGYSYCPPRDLPLQSNDYDCGVFYLEFLEKFLQNPGLFFRNTKLSTDLRWQVDSQARNKKITALEDVLLKEFADKAVERLYENAERFFNDALKEIDYDPAEEAWEYVEEFQTKVVASYNRRWAKGKAETETETASMK